MSKLPFYTFYNRPDPVCFKPDTETKFVDQSEADRASLKYQLERYGMDTLLQQFEKTKAQFGYADTRACKCFSDLAGNMAKANEYFSKLPSAIRKKFGHSSVEFFDSIEKNPEKMYKEGFISQEFYEKLCPKDIQNISPVDVQPVADVVEPATNVNTVVNNES